MAVRRCRPWSHQWFLRLDDWRVMCTECTAVKTDRRYRPLHLGHLEFPLPPIPQGGLVLSQYRKTLAAVAGVLAVVGQALADGDVSTAEWGLIVTAVAVAFGVYEVANKPAE